MWWVWNTKWSPHLLNSCSSKIHNVICGFLILMTFFRKNVDTCTHNSQWYFLWSSCWTCWELAPSGRINPSSLCCRLAGELKLIQSGTDVRWEITLSYSGVLQIWILFHHFLLSWRKHWLGQRTSNMNKKIINKLSFVARDVLMRKVVCQCVCYFLNSRELLPCSTQRGWTGLRVFIKKLSQTVELQKNGLQIEQTNAAFQLWGKTDNS